MKKIKSFFIISAILLISGCKDKEPVLDHGSVALEPSEIELVCGESIVITPYFSENGLSESKKYAWENNNENIISYKPITGTNKVEVTAKRVGEANITIYAIDGTISASSTIIVNPTIKFLPFIYFKSGENKRNVELESMGIKNESESTSRLLVYDINSAPITQYMYYFDDNDKLISTLVILENTAENLKNAEVFIEERYKNLNITTSELINYYDASINPRYEEGTVVGIFLPTSNPIPVNAKGKFGIKYTSASRI